MANLSEHFTFEELIRSATAARMGIANIPEEKHLPNLVRLCTMLLEPFREAIGKPMQINSGYRVPALNAAVGGVTNSAHMEGRAADFIVPGEDLSAVWRTLIELPLPWDQLIWETNRVGSQWIHAAVARDGEEPRREVKYLQKRPDRVRLG